MVKIAFGINGDVPPAKLETVSGLGARRSIGPPAREIVMVSQNATGSLEAIARLQALPEAPKVVVLLDRAADALELAGLNVDGMVISSPEVRRFLQCIESVASGERWVDPAVRPLIMSTRLLKRHALTRRERQIAEGVVRGLRNKEIAREIGVRETTVKMHLHNMFEKFKVASRTQLALAYSSPADLDDDESQPYDNL